MESLEKVLRKFSEVKGDKDKLEEIMCESANYFFYGGYFQVGFNKIYLTDIEFYYHEEGNEGKIHDYGMYHISKKLKENEKQALPFCSFYLHPSGMDFTFEDDQNKECKYRASILIRGIKYENGKTETRPTYICCDFLMNNSLLNDGFTIKWINDNKFLHNNNGYQEPSVRKNLPIVKPESINTKSKENYLYKDRMNIDLNEYNNVRCRDLIVLRLNKIDFIQCPRKWRFIKTNNK